MAKSQYRNREFQKEARCSCYTNPRKHSYGVQGGYQHGASTDDEAYRRADQRDDDGDRGKLPDPGAGDGEKHGQYRHLKKRTRQEAYRGGLNPLTVLTSVKPR